MENMIKIIKKIRHDPYSFEGVYDYLYHNEPNHEVFIKEHKEYSLSENIKKIADLTNDASKETVKIFIENITKCNEIKEILIKYKTTNNTIYITYNFIVNDLSRYKKWLEEKYKNVLPKENINEGVILYEIKKFYRELMRNFKILKTINTELCEILEDLQKE